MRKTKLELFEEKYTPEPNSGCWLWEGCGDNYGRFRYGSDHKLDGAHRVSYLLHKGEIPEGYVVDHRCKNKWCVNPEHLQAITQQQNVINGPFRGKNKEHKMICPEGHQKTTNAAGRIRCMICEREQQRIRSMYS